MDTDSAAADRPGERVPSFIGKSVARSKREMGGSFNMARYGDRTQHGPSEARTKWDKFFVPFPVKLS